ncbi:hypothetical protein [Mycolicibacterium llatzerense]|uniref:Uncharacterized protein n=1 Tax=Mycolicibacterium llatzerense TaxID=280871 RepID=A0A0D1LP81_9MYCO|nr:hypothetical protein [Mycolicibacterium llatzerense]KIU17896.1 hypothetical protein TL10_06475 [Mycolicibacterium llatzerense]
MNTLEVVLARRNRRAAWNKHAATLRDADKPKPSGPKPGKGNGRPLTHGHENAYWRHIKANEPACDECIEAHERAKEQQRIRHHERKAAG